MAFFRAAPMMVCAVRSVWKKSQNRNLCLLFAKFDSRYGHKSTHFGHKVSLNYHGYKIRILNWALHLSDPRQCHSPGTCTPFHNEVYIVISPAWSELGNLALLSNLSWLSKRLYILVFSKNLIQSLGRWATNVVVVRGVQVKSCSVMEMHLTVCFVCFRPACLRTIYF